MAERVETPVDEITGLPYCFAPPPDLAPVPRPGQSNIERPADWNHQYPKFEVRNSTIPGLDELGKRALEGCRVQWVDFKQHHYKYNPAFNGPELPQSHVALAGRLLFAESGYIPEVALDLNGESPRQVSLSARQRREMWLSGQVRVYSPSDVSKYLFAYVFDQDVDHIKENILEEFLTSQNLQRRIYLGHCLAAKIVERAVEPFEAVYVQAHRDGLLPTQLHPRDFVKKRLTTGTRFGRFINELNHKLAPHRACRRAEIPESIAA